MYSIGVDVGAIQSGAVGVGMQRLKHQQVREATRRR